MPGTSESKWEIPSTRVAWPTACAHPVVPALAYASRRSATACVSHAAAGGGGVRGTGVGVVGFEKVNRLANIAQVLFSQPPAPYFALGHPRPATAVCLPLGDAWGTAMERRASRAPLYSVDPRELLCLNRFLQYFCINQLLKD